MSDRSGVGAPTHDGADPESSGSGDPADTTVDTPAPSSRQSGRRARSSSSDDTASRPKRRLTADLFGAALGAEAATSSGPPPGVPGPARTDDEPAAEAPAPTSAATTAADPARAAAPASPAAGSAVRPDDDPTAATVVDRPLPVAEPEPAPVRAEATRPVEAAPADRDRPGRRRGALRARQVHRIIRRVDPWSVLKLSLLFFFCVWLMVVISGVLIWGVAVGSGTVESLEEFIANLLAFEEFSFNADQIFRLFAVGGLIMVFLGTAIAAILAVLFNLISDLIGGVRITVIEEETTRRIVRRS